MKKWISLLMILVLCTLMVCPVLAAGDDFTPSVSYKPAPDVEDKPGNLVITPIGDVDKSTEIPDDAREQLKDLYEDLLNGDTDLPDEAKDKVIRDLIDVSEIGDGVDWPVELTFDLGIGPDEKIWAMVYVDGQWKMIDVINNGDGTVTVILEEACPLAFLVDGENILVDAPYTGDVENNHSLLWGAVMAVSLVGIILLALILRKRSRG